MKHPNKVYVDFSCRDLEGSYYLARISNFEYKPHIGDRFIATDYDEFTEIECVIIGQYSENYVKHLPVRLKKYQELKQHMTSKTQEGES